MQSGTQTGRELITAGVFWSGNNGMQLLNPAPDGWLEDKPAEWGQFVLAITTKVTDDLIVSVPFSVNNDEITPMNNGVPNMDGTMMTFNKTIPVIRGNQGRNAVYYTHKSSNCAYVACIQGNRLDLTIVGIASQANEFYLHTKLKYSVEMFNKNGSLIIPDLKEWKSLPTFLSNIVDVNSLPAYNAERYFEDGIELIHPDLGSNRAEVLWCDPFANQIALRTDKGNALCPYKSINGIRVMQTLLNVPVKKIVKFERLEEPAANSRTSFPYIAKGVTV